MSDTNLSLSFPSGLSIRRAKGQAKEARKSAKYPTLIEALDAVAQREVQLPWAKAINYLERQQHLDKSNFFMTFDDIKSVMKENQDLTYHGIGISWQRGKPLAEYFKCIENAKAELLTKTALNECNRACQYLQHVEKRKTINQRRGSYGLKHSVEHYLQTRYPNKTRSECYVSNGAFLCAAHFMGFDIKKKSHTSINAWINCSQKSPIFLWRDLTSKRCGRTQKDLEKLAKLERELELPQSDATKQHEANKLYAVQRLNKEAIG